MIHRKIRVLVLNRDEFERLQHQFMRGKSLIIWSDEHSQPQSLKAAV